MVQKPLPRRDFAELVVKVPRTEHSQRYVYSTDMEAIEMGEALSKCNGKWQARLKGGEVIDSDLYNSR